MMLKNGQYAPIVVFVYNRLDCTQEVINSLARNSLASESSLFIFSDGAKNDSNIMEVNKVRAYINSINDLKLFKHVSVIEAKKNCGLAASVISGVSQIISEYGRVIVIEDDNICTSDFLQFMNDSLDFYENNRKIWSIGGYSSINDVPEDYYHSVYLMGRICSYAWGTWQNRWEKVDWTVQSYASFKQNFFRRHRFNMYGDDCSIMLDKQMQGWIDSWAIRFTYAMFENHMYTILPISTKCKNIGMDKRATHSKIYNAKFDIDLPKSVVPYVLEDVELDRDLVKRFRERFHQPIRNRQKIYIECVLKRKSGSDRDRVKRIIYKKCNRKGIFLEDDLSRDKVNKHFKHSRQILYIENVKEELIGIISIGDFKRHKDKIYINRNFFSFKSNTSLDEIQDFFVNHNGISVVPVIDRKRFVGEYICKRG